MMLAGLRYGSCIFFCRQAAAGDDQGDERLQAVLRFEESLQGPPLVTDFVAKVFWKFFRVEGLLDKDIIHV